MKNNISIVPLTEALASIIDCRGKTPRKLGGNWAKTGYRALSALNVKSDGLENLDQIKYVDDAMYKKWMKNEVERGDILLTSEAPAGQAYYWNSDEKIVLSQRVFALRTNSKFDAKYLTYYLRSNTGQKVIFNKMSGSTVSGISAKMFDFIQVISHALPTQRKIAEILFDIDSKIEQNTKVNVELEALAKLIYDYWFVQFDFPDQNGKPYKSSGGKMAWNDELQREIPEGWEVMPLGRLIAIKRGISYTSEEIKDEKGAYLLSLNSFRLDGNYKMDGIKFFSGKCSNKHTIKPGDLMIAATDVTRNADIIGKAFIVPDVFNSDEIYFSMDLAQITPSPRMNKHYLRLLFNSKTYHDVIKYYATGTLVLHLNMDGINWFKVPVPSDFLLRKYDTVMESIEKKKSLIMRESQQLASLRDWLLPMLLNGQVKVRD